MVFEITYHYFDLYSALVKPQGHIPIGQYDIQ